MKRLLIQLFLSLSAACVVFVNRTSAHIGSGIHVDREGRVVFLDSTRSRVWRLDAGGRQTVLASGKHGDNLVVDAEGNLFVENMNQSLWKISPSGEVNEITPAGRRNQTVGSLDELLAVDREGNFYFNDGNPFYPRAPRILKMTPTGQVTLLAGGAPGHADGRGSEARFMQLRAAAWGPDQSLYVTDGNSVRRVSLDGIVSTLAGSATAGFADGQAGNARFDRLLGIAVDPQGNLFVVDTDNFRIRKISPDGQVSTITRTWPPWKPAGVAVSGGEIYILELKFLPFPMPFQEWFTTHRVRKIAADGSGHELGTISGGGAKFVSAALGVLGLTVWGAWRRRRQRRWGMGK